MEKQFDPQNIAQLIRHRRSIGPDTFSDKRVERETIEELLEAARWAPTHGMTQPWHFVIFEEDGRKSLASFLSKWYKENTEESKFKEAKYLKYQRRPLKASYVLAICVKREEGTKIPEVEDVEAVACAVQNMHLLAAAYGLAAYWSSGGATYSKACKEFLGLEGNEDHCLGFFYIGYPANEWPEGRRDSMDHKCKWVSSYTT